MPKSSRLFVQLGRHAVPLTAGHGALEPLLPAVLEFRPFQQWAARLGRQLERPMGSRVEVRGVRVSDVDMFGRRIGFVKFTAGIRWAEDGKPLPGIVFCRGGAVAVLLIVRPSDAAAAVADQGGNDDDSWVVLTVQPRLPVALLEDPALPAGMLDGDSNFAGVAAKELEEECGIRMTAEDLVDLTSFRTLDEGDDEGAGVDETGLFPSAGGCDEFIRLFLCEKRLPLAQIRELEGREAGLRDEGERIRVKLVRLRDLWRSTRDMKALAALALYGIRRGGAA